jgi:NAD(P)-dependent dehydrogenase (short-subunit alcohol dehydrogenase family)
MDTPTSRSIVITGAAGALGQAAAHHFLGEGARLALIGRDEASVRRAFAGRIDTPPHLFVGADVTSEAGMAEAAVRIEQALGRVDVLVHVAGGFEMGEPVHALSRAAWDRMMDLNAWSFVAVTKAFVPQMLGDGAGKVVAVSAAGAARGEAQMAAYAASKSALQRLVEALSREVRGRGLNVNSIAPTIMDTPANRASMPKADHSAWVSTAVAAQTIGWLASDAALAVHGRHIIVG